MAVHLIAGGCARDEIDLKPGLVFQKAGFPDDFAGRFVGIGHHVQITRDMVGQNICRGGLWSQGEFFGRQQGHRFDAVGQCFALFGVIELACFGQDQPMVGGVFDHLRGPHDTAAGIVATEDRHDHSIVGADVLKTAENAGWNIENIAGFQRDFARIAPAPPKEPPAA